MTDDDFEIEAKDKEQRAILWVLLAINAAMFLVELSAGVFAQSTGLIADSLDMFADATVYAISLFAVGRSNLAKANAALMSGILQILLALLVLIDVARRFIFGSDPLSAVMIAVGILALAANVIALILIRNYREGEVHMRASWIFSQNDVIVNLGVILGGVLVALMGSRFPDLVIGALVAIVVFRGGVRIIRDAKGERRNAQVAGA
jgi:Co/Zn/Cd efflux system component